MGKMSKKEERRNALKCLDEPPTDLMRDDVRKALAQYCHDEDIDVRKKGKLEVKLKDLLHIMRRDNDFWNHIRVDDLNTNRHRAVKLLNDMMHKLLHDKNKLAGMIRDLDSDSQGSDDEGSSPIRSLKGDDAMAEACGELNESKKYKKSKVGRNPPEKAKSKIGKPKEEQKQEEAADSSSSNQISATPSEDEGERSHP